MSRPAVGSLGFGGLAVSLMDNAGPTEVSLDWSSEQQRECADGRQYPQHVVEGLLDCGGADHDHVAALKDWVFRLSGLDIVNLESSCRASAVGVSEDDHGRIGIRLKAPGICEALQERGLPFNGVDARLLDCTFYRHALTVVLFHVNRHLWVLQILGAQP